MYHFFSHPDMNSMAVLTCDRGTGCARAGPGCSRCKRLDLQGSGTQGPMQAAPQRAADLDHLHGTGAPPPLSAPLPVAPPARGN